MIRIGMIGAGPMGRGNARGLSKHTDRCTIAAVADPSAEAAGKIAQEYGARAAADLTEILDDVDAVVISTPNFMHPDQAVACASAGKHVFIEKPKALTTADADRIAAAVDKANVASMVGFSVRFEGIMQEIKKRFAGGELGDLLSMFSRRITCFPEGKGWRAEYDKSGGVMSELMAHEIDWMVDIAGMPKSVYCRKSSRRHQDPRDNEHVWLTMAFDTEATATIEGSQMALFSDYYRGLIGSKGAASTRNWGRELHVQYAANKSEQVQVNAGFDKYGHFLDAIEGRCAPVADARYGRNIVYLTEKAIESAVCGQAVAL